MACIKTMNDLVDVFLEVMPEEEVLESVRDGKAIAEFEQAHCMDCGSQRCDGVYSEWFSGCVYKPELEAKVGILGG